MPRTKKDLMLETHRIILDSVSPTAMREFERHLLPHLLRNCPTLQETVSDEEFEREVAKIRDNLPGMIAYFRQYKIPPETLMHFGGGRN